MICHHDQPRVVVKSWLCTCIAVQAFLQHLCISDKQTKQDVSATGPMLRVVEGDTLEVVFKNTLDFETSLVPMGVIHSENDTMPVATDETVTYSWNITSDVSPLPFRRAHLLHICWALHGQQNHHSFLGIRSIAWEGSFNVSIFPLSVLACDTVLCVLA